MTSCIEHLTNRVFNSSVTHYTCAVLHALHSNLTKRAFPTHLQGWHFTWVKLVLASPLG